MEKDLKYSLNLSLWPHSFKQGCDRIRFALQNNLSDPCVCRVGRNKMGSREANEEAIVLMTVREDEQFTSVAAVRNGDKWRIYKVFKR